MAFTDDEKDKLRSDVAYYFQKINRETFYISGDKSNKSFDKLMMHMHVLLDLPFEDLPGVKACIGFFHTKISNPKANTLVSFNNYVIACKDLLEERGVSRSQSFGENNPFPNDRAFGTRVTCRGAFPVDGGFIQKINEANKDFFSDDFYLGHQQSQCQWYGIICNDGRGWDVLRECYSAIETVVLSTHSCLSTLIVICGEKGSGKSTLLKRLSINLINNYTIILWITNIRLFEENLTYISLDFDKRYILFLDNWEEQVKATQDEGVYFLTQLSKLDNLTIILTDYTTKNKAYLSYLKEECTFFLSPDENIFLLEKLALKNSSWRPYIDSIIFNSEFIINPLYIILFVVMEHHSKGSIREKNRFKNFIPEFREIIKSDLEQVSSVNWGAALALHHFAILYKTHGLVFSWNGYASIANDLNRLFLKKAKKLNGFDKSDLLCKMLSKYMYLEDLPASMDKKNQACYFHHRLLPEEGLSCEISSFVKYYSHSALELYNSLAFNDLKLSNDLYKIICAEGRGIPEQMDPDITQYFSFDVSFNELLNAFYTDAESVADETHWHYNLFWIIFYMYENNPKGLPSILSNLINRGCNAACVLKLIELCASPEFVSQPKGVLYQFAKEIYHSATAFGAAPQIFHIIIERFRNSRKENHH